MTERAIFRWDASWRRRDAMTLAVLAGIATAFLAWERFERPVDVGASLPVFRDRSEQARERIDPRTAGVASLRRLPGVGIVKAQAIVSYRQSRPKAFAVADDLLDVPGIGPVGVKRMQPYLSFPHDASMDDGESQE